MTHFKDRDEANPSIESLNAPNDYQLRKMPVLSPIICY
ncbi:unnamed protein product [Acidithrix sp. C25]|nr:unnamed protein product [Acidithrix sp. C25]